MNSLIKFYRKPWRPSKWLLRYISEKINDTSKVKGFLSKLQEIDNQLSLNFNADDEKKLNNHSKAEK